MPKLILDRFLYDYHDYISHQPPTLKHIHTHMHTHRYITIYLRNSILYIYIFFLILTISCDIDILERCRRSLSCVAFQFFFSSLNLLLFDRIRCAKTTILGLGCCCCDYTAMHGNAFAFRSFFDGRRGRFHKLESRTRTKKHTPNGNQWWLTNGFSSKSKTQRKCWKRKMRNSHERMQNTR